MPFFDQQFKASQVTIDEYWAFERNCVEMAPDEFKEYMESRVKFMTPLQKDGAMTCIRKVLSDFHTPPARQAFLATQIYPLLEDAIEHPFDPQQSLF